MIPTLLVTIGYWEINKIPIPTPPAISLGGNTIAIYLHDDGLLWAWGQDARVLSKILRLPLRTAIEQKTVWQYVTFRYRGDIDECQTGLNKILPYNVAIIRK